MFEALKHPAWLIGAVVIGMIVFAGRRGGGADSGARLQAAIASQEIATRGNVALSETSARRDVDLARAHAERSAIRAAFDVETIAALTASRAVTLGHVQTMKQLGVMERLGQAEIDASRDIAFKNMETTLAATRMAADVRTLEVQTAAGVRLSEVAASERLASGQLGFSYAELASLERIRANEISAGLAMPSVIGKVQREGAEQDFLYGLVNRGLSAVTGLLSGGLF